VVDGRRIHQVALPWHWGYHPPYPGDSTNDLGVLSGDPNVMIQESKAFTCDVRAGRRSGPTTARLKGVGANLPRVAPNEDDRSAENPKEVAP
jgi:formate dehydrogenase major subunit